MAGLSARGDVLQHQLAFAVRFDDHFMRAPVPEELVVSLVGDPARPVLAPGGTTARQPDGTYRFVDLADGPWSLTVNSSRGLWMSLAPLAPIDAAAAAAPEPVRYDLWPTVRAQAPPGVTCIRGKVTGGAIEGLKVELAPVAESFDRWTQTDADGEFLFLLPLPLPVDDDGLATLKVQLDSGERIVTEGSVFGEYMQEFTGDQFKVRPGREFRVEFET